MLHHTYFAKSLLLTALFFGTTAAIFAADGKLDLSFDGDGIVSTDNAHANEGITDLQVQSDGKIIAVGYSGETSSSTLRTVIVRYNPNGSIDSTFGTSGKVFIQSVFPSELVLQPTGKIFFVGSSRASSNGDFYAARLNFDGSFDTTFNGSGAVTLDLRGTNDSANSVKIQPDDKIIVGGYSQRSSSDTRNDFAIVRFNTNGSLDTTFDGDGKVFTIITSAGETSNIADLDIQSDGKILAAGSVFIVDAPGSDPIETFATVRYNSDGSLDATFDGDGRVTTRFSLIPSNPTIVTESSGRRVFAQSDGKILVIGSARSSCGSSCLSEAAIVRLNTNGSIDTTFDGDGKLLISSAFSFFDVNDATIQADNKIILVGNAGQFGSLAGIARIHPDGSLDLSYNGNGRSIITPPNTGRNILARAVALQPDGKIIVGGRIDNHEYTENVGFTVLDFLLARLEASSCFAKCINARQKVADFDGDGKNDLSVFRNGSWFINPSSVNNPNNYYSVPFGLATDKLVPADYDGDGKTDIAVWRENVVGTFGYVYILYSSTNTFRVTRFGRTGDDPRVVGDWDGDTKADLAAYRSGTSAGAQGYFYYLSSSQFEHEVRLNWGTAGDEAVRGDFDGDGRMDAAVFRPSDGIWYIQQSSNAQVRYERWGLASDKRVAGDFDGDGKTDLAIYRDGLWAVLQSSNNQPRYERWGLSTDRLVAGDYDGDGRTDFAVWRAGVYYILQNSNSQVVYQYFGSPNDIPVASAFVR